MLDSRFTTDSVLKKYTTERQLKGAYHVPKGTTALCEIAYKYRVDKCERIKHPYTPFYFDLFNDWRYSVRKVLEIGIGDSPNSSLFMWRDFFPNAQIYGADILASRIFQDDRIKTFLCDQNSKDDLFKLVDSIGKDIDILIDDGSHLPEDQIFTCNTLMPMLNKNTVYLIEDVADQSIEKSLVNFNVQTISLRHTNGRRFPDDRITVVRNKA